MSFDYIRRAYGVPARKGAKVKYKGRRGVVTGESNGYLKIRFDGEKRAHGVFHPTWEIEYLEKA